MLEALLLTCSAAAASMSTAAWLSNGRARGELKLGLLPFLAEHTLLPGESRDIFLFDESLRQCVASAASGYGLVGGLMMTETGEACELCTLLRLGSVESDEWCTWVRVTCMSRCTLGSLQKNKQHGYRVGVVEPYADDTVAVPGSVDLDGLRELHAEVAAQRRSLAASLRAASAFDDGTWEVLSREAAEKPERAHTPRSIYVREQYRTHCPFGVYESYEAFEETGRLENHVYVGRPWEHPSALGCCYFNCRDLGELDDAENGATLDELCTTRRAGLEAEPCFLATSSADEFADAQKLANELADDGKAASQPTSQSAVEQRLVSAVGKLWAARSEDEAQAQLLSFAAAATLSPAERAEALLLNDTSERLALAADGLRVQRQLLAALCVQHGAAEPS